MGFKLSSPPGFADLADSVLASGSPALGVDIAKIHENSRFSVVRTEVFSGVYKHGDTISLPVSTRDGYAYSRHELMYFWTVRNSADPSTLWISGADSLFYAAWDVDQTTGQVFSDEWYRRSGSHADVFHSNDGLLQVWTVAQRQLTNLTVASSPSYSAISAGSMALDKPLTQQLAQGLNDSAKFACLNHGFAYLGEYTNGQTVTLPIDPADGYHFSAAECTFVFSWRWTSVGSVAPMQAPPLTYGQMGPMKASVNSSGLVSCSVGMIDDNGNLNQISSLGRIAVFAFCQRSGTPGTITPTANQFAEISFDQFMPGADLAFKTLQQIESNIQQGLLTPEFFGPTAHANGDTIALPTSARDSYAYSRNECTYLWSWVDTTNQTGSDLRMPLFNGHVDPVTGIVTLHVWRLPPGGPYVDDNDSLARISVTIIATRQASAAPAALPPPTTSTPAGVSTPGTVDLPNGSSLQVNGVAIPSPEVGNLNDSTPAAPSGSRNVAWQADALDPTNISASVPNIGGVDARTTTSESIGIASQGKLVTLNNSSAIAVALDSTAGGGGGGVTAYDMLNWVLTGYPDRTTHHYAGTGVYAANWLDADGQKIYLVKNPAGNPYDIYIYDSNWIYHWLTENADEGTWSSASAWKRFLTPVPVIPRFFVPGSTVTKTTLGSNPIERTIACGTDGEPLINIGNITAVTTGPVTVAWGGDVGTQPTITVTYYYGHQREEFKYVQGVGLVEWTHATLGGGVYNIDETTLHLTHASGGCPTPNVPCYATMLAASKWIGGAPGSGGNVANPSSSPPTPGAVPSKFFCAVKNVGAGTATLTPTSGTIDGGSSLALGSGQSAWLFFDGTNWTTADLNATSPIEINGVGLSSAAGNFSDSAPSAPTGTRNVKWQKDTSSPNDVSANVPNIGGVDPRTTTSETVGLASQGKLVTISNASAVAVSLSSTVGSSFLCAIANLGTGTATLTPSSGTINGGASLALATNQAGWLFFDGTNWQAVLLGSGFSGSAWSSLTNPSGNLSLAMGAQTSLFTYNAATGAGVDLFNLTDTASNSGTGALLSISTASLSKALCLRLKQLDNGQTQGVMRMENINAAVIMEMHVNDILGVGTTRIEQNGGPFMLTRGGTGASNTLLKFDGINTSKWLGTITSNFDGLTSTEVGLTVNNTRASVSSTSTAAVLSVQNNGTRLLDVSPAATNVKSGAFIVATSHTPSSSSDTGVTGTIAWDSSFIYICVATNTWKRVAISTF